MKAVIINYNYTPNWIKDYDLDYLIADRSDDGIDHLKDFDQSRVIRTKNVGNVDYDRLSYLLERYDDLPDTFLWIKSNIFKYTTKEEFEDALKNPRFKPLLRFDHKTYSDRIGRVNYYEQDMYWERNDSWYLSQFPCSYKSFNEWAVDFGLPSNLRYLPFPPGGNFMLTREVVHKHSRDLYERMKDTLPYIQLPGEAQLCERSYYLLWR